jgi:hypothetical protein
MAHLDGFSDHVVAVAMRMEEAEHEAWLKAAQQTQESSVAHYDSFFEDDAEGNVPKESPMNPDPKSTSTLDPSMLRSYPGPKLHNHERERVSATLKEQINALLWAVLPPSTTLYSADQLAARWCNEVLMLWEREAEEEAR